MTTSPSGHRGRRLPLWLLAGVLALVLTPGVLVGYESYTHLNTDGEAEAPEPLTPPDGFTPYVLRPTGEQADPVNLIFRAADADAVSEAVQRLLGWQSIAGGGMTFLDNGKARPSLRQLGLNLGGGSRFHLRIAQTDTTEATGYVLAAVHRDVAVPCGHVGLDFDSTRDLVASAFAAAGYRVTSVSLGNTRLGTHCDGTQNAGDGSAVLIDLTTP